MPAWEEYKAHAKERGALAFEVYVAVSTPVADPAEIMEVLPDHLAYIRSLEVSGQLMFAGPLSDETGTQMQAMGMLVLRAANMEEAKELAANDPMHKAGVRSFVLRKWLINEGQVMVSLGLSGQTAKLI
ncbi:MAG: YciI family protein [Pseudomonadota bacterium]